MLDALFGYADFAASLGVFCPVFREKKACADEGDAGSTIERRVNSDLATERSEMTVRNEPPRRGERSESIVLFAEPPVILLPDADGVIAFFRVAGFINHQNRIH